MNTQNFKVLNLEQGSQEWLDSRLHHITATEIAHLKCGHTSLYTLVALKRGLAKPPYLDNNPAVQEGKTFEPLIREYLIKVACPWLLADGEKELDTPCCESLEEPFFMASLDGYSYKKNCVVEIKNIFSKNHERFQDVVKNGLNSQACLEFGYYYQVQWQLYVTGAKVGLLCFHNPKNSKDFNPKNIFIIPIKRDEAVIKELKELAYKVKDILDNNIEVEPEPGDEVFVTNEQQQSIQGRLNEFRFIEELIKDTNDTLVKLKAKKQIILDSLKEELLGDKISKISGSNFTLNVYERKGSLDYDKLFEDHNVAQSDVENYRKAPTLLTKLTLK